MRAIKTLFLMASMSVASGVVAGSMYDDWTVEQVPDQIKTTTLYYGNNTCEAYIKNGYYEPTFRLESRYVPLTKSDAVSTPRPTYQISVPYVDAYNNHTYKSFSCPTVGNYPLSYVKEEVISYKNKYTPKQPYSSYINYEYLSCNYGIRRGTIDIGEPAVAVSNMKVFVSNGSSDFPDTKIYDGAPNYLIGFDVYAESNLYRKVRVKFDNGSSAYHLGVQIPRCSGSANDQ